MGKVGSTTLTESLSSTEIPYTIYKIHRLSKKGISIDRQRYAQKGMLFSQCAAHHRLGSAIRSRLERIDAPIPIVTGTREPIDRAVSALFQTIHWEYQHLIEPDGSINVERTLEFIHRTICEKKYPAWKACTWFDEEIKSVLKVDVYNYPFDEEKGFSLVENSKFRILILRRESFSRGFENGIPALLGRSVAMKRANRAESKQYSNAYRQVKRQLTLPKHTLDEYYTTKYVRHFYDSGEIDSYRTRWSSAQSD